MGKTSEDGPLRRRAGRLMAAALVFATVLTAAPATSGPAAATAATPGTAQTPDERDTDAPARALAARFAPIVMLKEQTEPCDTTGEPYAPMAVDELLDNPQVALRQVGRGDPVVTWAPDASDLFGLGEGFYLDFPGDALDPGCVYERDFGRLASAQEPIVYAHIATQPDRPDRIAVQYWFYWYFNDWNDKHEGDWEFVQVLLPASSISEALEVEPVGVGFAQHSGGERADWNSSKLERDGDRIVVYPSAGSHASYFGSALYLGRSADEGFGCDNTDSPSVRADPGIVLLPDEVADPADPLAWLAFDGRWGERHPSPNNGPTGPTSKTGWASPVDWQEDLRPSSFVVPGGDGTARQVIDSFCGVVAWGSLLFLDFQSSPIQILAVVVVLALVVRFLVQRTSWRVVDALPVVRRRRAGEIIRSALRLAARRPAVFATLGLLYLPFIVLAGVIGAALRHVPLIGDAVTVYATGPGSVLGLSLLVGALTVTVASVGLTASAAWLLDAMATGANPTAGEAFRAVRPRSRDLGSGLLRSFVLVAVLQLTVIGLPFAIWYLVRFQFMAPAVTLEGLGGRRGLARSAALVRGRWWHTAVVVATVGIGVGGAGLAIGLVLLVVFTGLPLWALSVIVAAINIAVLPVGAIVISLLYGDAVAEQNEELTDVGLEPTVV